MSQPLEQWCPRLAESARVLPGPEGGRLVWGPGARATVYVTPDEAGLLEGLVGDTDLRGLVVGRSQGAGRMDFAAVLRVLESLHEARLLMAPPPEVQRVFRARRGLYHRSPLGRLLDLSLMIPLRRAPRPRPSPLVRWLALGVLLGGLGLLLAALAIDGEALLEAARSPLRLGPDHAAGALAFLLGLVSTLSFRGALRFVFLMLAGLTPSAVGLRLRLGVPFLDAPGSAVRGLPRRLAAGLALLGLGAPALWAGVLLLAGYRLGDPGMAHSALAALLVLALDLCPFARSDLGVLLERWTGIPMVRARVGRFLRRRLARNVLRRDPANWVERRYLLLATLWVAYVAAAALLARPIAAGALGLATWLWRGLLGAGLEPLPPAGLPLAVVAAWLMAFFLVATGAALAALVGALRGLLPGEGVARPASSNPVGVGSEASELLTRIPPFQLVGAQPVAQALAASREESYRPGDLVLRQGDPGAAFHVVLEGEAVVGREEESGLVQRMARLERGHGFGELSLLNDAPRTAGVRALTPLRVLTVPRAAFLELLRAAGPASTPPGAAVALHLPPVDSPADPLEYHLRFGLFDDALAGEWDREGARKPGDAR